MLPKENQKVLDCLARHLMGHGKLFVSKSNIQDMGYMSKRQLALALNGTAAQWSQDYVSLILETMLGTAVFAFRLQEPGIGPRGGATRYYIDLAYIKSFLNRVRLALKKFSKDYGEYLDFKNLMKYSGIVWGFGFGPGFFPNLLAGWGGTT